MNRPARLENGMVDENTEIIQEFCRETEAHLAGLDEHIAALRPFIFNIPFEIQQYVNFVTHLNIPAYIESLHAINRIVHTIKGVTGFLDFSKCNRYCHKMEELTLNLSKGNTVLDQAAFQVIARLPSVLNRFLERIKETSSEAGVSVDKEIEQIETTNLLLLGKMGGQRVQLEELQGKDFGKPREQARNLKITIDLDVYDRIVRSFQAFVQESLNMMHAAGVTVDVSHFFRTGMTDHMDNLIMMARHEMVLSRYLRIVQDLGNSLGKNINFDIGANAAKARPDIWDHCHNAMIHLVRNAVDHGIELPEIRRGRGKAEEGNIHLEINEDFRNILILLKDDGGGIDGDRVAEIAVARGIVSNEEVSRMSAGEKQELIFLPGFSTRTTISDVSGRGVGMDAVKKEIEGVLKGKVTIRSVIGEGTEFRLEIPKMETLSECVLFGRPPHIYAIPMVADVEYMECRGEYIRSVFEKSPIYTERGMELPLLHIFARLHPEEYGDLPLAGLPIIRIGRDSSSFGLVVPDIRSQERLNIFRSQRLNSLMGGQSGIIFGFGLTDPVIPVLDIDQLAAML